MLHQLVRELIESSTESKEPSADVEQLKLEYEQNPEETGLSINLFIK